MLNVWPHTGRIPQSDRPSSEAAIAECESDAPPYEPEGMARRAGVDTETYETCPCVEGVHYLCFFHHYYLFLHNSSRLTFFFIFALVARTFPDSLCLAQGLSNANNRRRRSVGRRTVRLFDDDENAMKRHAREKRLEWLREMSDAIGERDSVGDAERTKDEWPLRRMLGGRRGTTPDATLRSGG